MVCVKRDCRSDGFGSKARARGGPESGPQCSAKLTFDPDGRQSFAHRPRDFVPWRFSGAGKHRAMLNHGNTASEKPAQKATHDAL